MDSSLWQIDMDFPNPAARLNHELTSLLQDLLLHPDSVSSLSSSSVQPSTFSGSTNEGSPARNCRKRKRKSRAKPKVPATQLWVDKHNFKDIVHQFTGAHSNPPLHSASFCKPATPSVVKAPTENHVLLAGIAYSLRALETLCAHFLLHGSSTEVQRKISEAQAPTNMASQILFSPEQKLGFFSKVEELERFSIEGGLSSATSTRSTTMVTSSASVLKLYALHNKHPSHQTLLPSVL